MQVVILGCGRLGARLASSLVTDGHKVAVVDNNDGAFTRLGPDFAGRTVVGTGIDEDVLKHAGIEHADAFVAVTDQDNTNLMAAQVAKEVFHVGRVICRVYDPLTEEIYKGLGLETICPTVWGASRVREILASR
jgi:trk system potassium uptake protein TrkA